MEVGGRIPGKLQPRIMSKRNRDRNCIFFMIGPLIITIYYFWIWAANMIIFDRNPGLICEMQILK